MINKLETVINSARNNSEFADEVMKLYDSFNFKPKVSLYHLVQKYKKQSNFSTNGYFYVKQDELIFKPIICTIFDAIPTILDVSKYNVINAKDFIVVKLGDTYTEVLR